jgi:membrane protease YdiL (CAAX protease family)
MWMSPLDSPGWATCTRGGAGTVTTGVSGLLFALIFLHRRRIADAMVPHAGFDLLGVAAAYALYGQRA